MAIVMHARTPARSGGWMVGEDGERAPRMQNARASLGVVPHASRIAVQLEKQIGITSPFDSLHEGNALKHMTVSNPDRHDVPAPASDTLAVPLATS